MWQRRGGGVRSGEWEGGGRGSAALKGGELEVAARLLRVGRRRKGQCGSGGRGVGGGTRLLSWGGK